ncbi:tyrosine phosphatase family-domain-containing protein [Paraphoma chrysanthemicola]|nr:tyrosine phosphatase family-domain-containing protein [Paraphoma chrysanthemicola]
MLHQQQDAAQTPQAIQLQAQLEHVQDTMKQLELPVSVHLLQHAMSTFHEDLPHQHVCGGECIYNSRGTSTPASSIYSATQTTDATADASTDESIPIDNFSIVLPGMVYRSSYPKKENYGYIKDHKIKSILTLVPEPIAPEYQAFMDEAGIQHFQVHIRANKGKVSTESCEMSRALRLVMDRANHPILIHCNKGKHRTGCTVACFRRILDAPMDEIIDEYHFYAGAKARLMDEVFFEGFDLNLVMWMARQEGWVAPEQETAPASRFSFMDCIRAMLPEL